MFDRELLFQMLANKEWDAIAKAMQQHSRLIGIDPVFAQAMKLFESQFFIETDHLTSIEKRKVYESPSIIIDLNRHAFSSDFVQRFIEKNYSY